jgi:hypothetical protein
MIQEEKNGRKGRHKIRKSSVYRSAENPHKIS